MLKFLLKRFRRWRYARYLRSRRWQGKRKDALHRAGYRCEYRRYDWRCKATKRLDVHHLTYKRFGNEQLDDLMVVCRFHHDKLHDWRKKR